MDDRTWIMTYHVSRTPRGTRGARKSGRTWIKQGVFRNRMNHKAREVPTDRRLIIARALLLSTNPYSYPRPGFNLPMGPGGPGGPGGPVGPWGQWLLVSVKVLDSNESPGGGKIASERSWGVGQPLPVTSATLALTALQDSLQHGRGHQYQGTERKGTWVLTLPQSG